MSSEAQRSLEKSVQMIFAALTLALLGWVGTSINGLNIEIAGMAVEMKHTATSVVKLQSKMDGQTADRYTATDARTTRKDFERRSKEYEHRLAALETNLLAFITQFSELARPTRTP